MSVVPTFLENIIGERDRLSRRILIPWEILDVIGTSKTGEPAYKKSEVVKFE